MQGITDLLCTLPRSPYRARSGRPRAPSSIHWGANWYDSYWREEPRSQDREEIEDEVPSLRQR